MKSLLIIAAGGNQTRWNNPYPKQLITIKGEPLIDRHLRLFGPYIEDYLILSEHPMIVDRYQPNVWWPADHRYICESLVETKHMWGERTILLHGDTVLSRRATKHVATDMRPCAFWGCWSDLFTVSVREHENNALALALWSACRHAVFEGGNGKLWEAYRAYCGLDMDDHTFDDKVVFVDTMDWSRDFDTIEEYECFKRQMRDGEVEVD